MSKPIRPNHRYIVKTCKKKYWWVYDPVEQRSRGEHRVIVEKILGRSLEPNEHVHHKNGNGLDNDPKNLEVLDWVEHMRLHNKLPPSKWSRDHEKCVECGKTDRKHASHGKCWRCYFRNWMRERKHLYNEVPSLT